VNSFIKLRSGDWGLRLEGKDAQNARKGRIIYVQTKERGNTEKTIKEVIFTGDFFTVCSFYEEHEAFTAQKAQDEYVDFLKKQKQAAEDILKDI